MVEFNAEIQTNAATDGRVSVAQNLAVDSWSNISSFRNGRRSTDSSAPGSDHNETLNCALNDDIYKKRGPKANLQSLHQAEDNFTFAHKEMQDALDALRNGDTKEGIQEIKDAIGQISQGIGNTRDGVGGDFDLSKLPESNPLRRVGSGRQAIKSGRTDLYDALNKLDGDCPDVAGAIKAIEQGLGRVLGGTANVNKAVGLIERGESDHRPKKDHGENKPEPPKPEPQPDCPPAPALPELLHRHEYNTGNRHLGKAIGSLSESIGEIRRGDFGHAFDELKGTLKQIQSATKDYRYAFGGEVPGGSAFNSAELTVFKAIRNLRSNNFEDTITDIEQALTKLRDGGGDVRRAGDQRRTND